MQRTEMNTTLYFSLNFISNTSFKLINKLNYI